MALELNGTTGVSLVQDGVVTAADLSSTLDLSGKTVTLPSGVGGKVLQVVAANGRVQNWSTSSTTHVQVGTSSITITPTSTSSRIFVTWQITTHINTVSGTPATAELSAYRGATDLGTIFGTRNVSADAGNDYFDKTTQVSIVDHPNTTNATTYSLYAKVTSGSTDFFAHRSFVDNNVTPRMRMVAMEIDTSTEWSS